MGRFVQIAGERRPSGIAAQFHIARGGVRLRAATAPALGLAQGTVVLLNGRTEFIEKYFDVIADLQQRSYNVVTLDWRGQGLSDRSGGKPEIGHVNDFDDYVHDLECVLKETPTYFARPFIGLAHSMGGAILLRALQLRAIDVQACVFSAPMWGLLNIPDWAPPVLRAAKVFGLGHLPVPGASRAWAPERFEDNVLTHDWRRHAKTQKLLEIAPDLRLAAPSIGWVVAAMDLCEKLHRSGGLGHVKIPILVASAAEEALVDNRAHEEFAHSLARAVHVTIPDARHELMMERDPARDAFFSAFDTLAQQVAR